MKILKIIILTFFLRELQSNLSGMSWTVPKNEIQKEEFNKNKCKLFAKVKDNFIINGNDYKRVKECEKLNEEDQKKLSFFGFPCKYVYTSGKTNSQDYFALVPISHDIFKEDNQGKAISTLRKMKLYSDPQPQNTGDGKKEPEINCLLFKSDKNDLAFQKYAKVSDNDKQPKVVYHLFHHFYFMKSFTEMVNANEIPFESIL